MNTAMTTTMNPLTNADTGKHQEKHHE